MMSHCLYARDCSVCNQRRCPFENVWTYRNWYYSLPEAQRALVERPPHPRDWIDYDFE